MWLEIPLTMIRAPASTPGGHGGSEGGGEGDGGDGGGERGGGYGGGRDGKNNPKERRGAPQHRPLATGKTFFHCLLSETEVVSCQFDGQPSVESAAVPLNEGVQLAPPLSVVARPPQDGSHHVVVVVAVQDEQRHVLVATL